MKKICNTFFQVGLTSLILATLSYLFFDKSAAIALSELSHSGILYKTSTFIDFWTGSNKMVYIELLIGVLGSRYALQEKNATARKFAIIFLSYFVAYVVTFAIKMLVARYRPELFLSDQLYGFSWFNSAKEFTSMPSGHSAVNFALALSISVILYTKHRFICMVLILFSISVAMSRVVLTAHYISDVLTSLTVTCWSIIYVLNIKAVSTNSSITQNQ